VLDIVTLERRGIPGVVMGQDKLVNTSGKGMAKAQGYPDTDFATYPYTHSAKGSTASDEEIKAFAGMLAARVEAILTGKA